jgi:hypothetical protein
MLWSDHLTLLAHRIDNSLTNGLAGSFARLVVPPS